jgi:drug/metabolite transporter (DMT)-like permease
MNDLILILIGVLGAILTFYVSESLKQGAVRASALLSLIVGAFLYAFPTVLNAYLTQNVPIVFMGTSFIGMVSAQVTRSYRLLAIAGGLFGIIYIHKSYFFDGYGGALGTLACVTLLFTLSVYARILKNTK